MFIILLFAVVFTTQANENLWNLSFKDLFTEYIKTHFETMSPFENEFISRKEVLLESLKTHLRKIPNAGKQVREVINLLDILHHLNQMLSVMKSGITRRLVRSFSKTPQIELSIAISRKTLQWLKNKLDTLSMFGKSTGWCQSYLKCANLLFLTPLSNKTTAAFKTYFETLGRLMQQKGQLTVNVSSLAKKSGINKAMLSEGTSILESRIEPILSERTSSTFSNCV
ncbi:unnamed protein product [Fasciola hepatica]|uniref:Uncharacterized protein n=1 Tax=Fasciola hepatica TaxID=6192 RepID=A0ABC9HHS2_FASHE